MNNMLASIFWLTISFIKITAANPIFSPAISTTSGVVQGKLLHVGPGRLGLDVYEFLGVPYAESPIGERRFKRATPLKPLTSSLLVATKPPKACPQQMGIPIFHPKYADMMLPIEENDEDCLYLNIWTPRWILDELYASRNKGGRINLRQMLDQQSFGSSLAVMVWFHGGGFSSGSTQIPVYNGSALAAYNNVIVVSVQYRLGVLGFGYMANGGDEMPGNMGLTDQIEALKWVKGNIGAFGGHVDRVTLFGHNAGAASVGFHLLIEESRPLFQRAILQSGSPTSSAWSYLDKKSAHDRTVTFAENVRCSQSRRNLRIPSLMSCLREKSFAELVGVQDSVLTNSSEGYFGLPFGNFLPVVDGVLIKKEPKDLLKDITSFDKEVLLGSNTEDASLLMLTSRNALEILPTPYNDERSLEKLNRTHFSKFIEEFFAFYPRQPYLTNKMVFRFIESQYRSCDPDNIKGGDVLKALVEATTDFAVICPVVELADALSSLTDVYLYSFSHRNNMEFWPSWMGSTYSDEIPLVMGFPFTSTGQFSFNWTPAERMLSRQIMSYWTNFAKFGNVSKIDMSSPNGMQLQLNPWQAYNSTSKLALSLHTIQGINLAEKHSDYDILYFKERQCTFWNEMLPTFVSSLRNSCNPTGINSD